MLKKYGLSGTLVNSNEGSEFLKPPNLSYKKSTVIS